MKPVRTRLILLSLAVLLRGQADPQTLADVRTIFVDTLGHGDLVTVIRDKIINRLVASGRFQVVTNPDKADATLTGTVTEVNLGNGWDATAVVRLVTKDERILWVSEAKNAKKVYRPPPSASSSVADRVVGDLLKAIDPPKKKK